MQEVGFTMEKETQGIDPVRLVEQAVLGYTIEGSAVLQKILKKESLTPEGFDDLCRLEMSSRALSGRVHVIAELFCAEDVLTAVRVNTYDTEQFFTALAKQINQALALHGRGSVRFKPKEPIRKTLSFDARRVSMILYHLVSNALKHGHTENKNVDILCVTGRFEAEIAVRDYGGGLLGQKKEDLFALTPAPFSLDDQMLGAHPVRFTGLGLPLCRKLARDMKGDVTLKNYKTGVKVTLTLPQDISRLQEPTLFCPDDSLMLQCMADLWK